MRSLIALLLALAIAFGIYYFYLKRVQPAGPGNAPTQAISVTGVENDLLAIAQAERVYFTEHGAYGSLDELTASGALTLPRAGRQGYNYSVETTATGFTVTARHSGNAPAVRYPTIIVDETLQIRRVD